jgi:hypothetical protein
MNDLLTEAEVAEYARRAISIPRNEFGFFQHAAQFLLEHVLLVQLRLDGRATPERAWAVLSDSDPDALLRFLEREPRAWKACKPITHHDEELLRSVRCTAISCRTDDIVSRTVPR